MVQKIKWKLFWKESCVLTTHTLLAGFYMRIAQMLFEYYKSPVLAALALTTSLSFAIPLCVNFLDLWARSVGAVCEDALSEKMLNISISVHKSLFGSYNAFTSEKQGILASLYFETGKLDEARALFDKAWERYRKTPIKFPCLHSCFADYIKILSTAGDTEQATQVQSSLKSANRFRLVQKICTALVTVPLICFLLLNQATERSIAKHNMHGQTIVALNEVNALAHNESLLLGQYAAAKVYADYAQAFSDTEAQLSEMEWCADKALYALHRSGKTDEYLQVQLLNLKARANVTAGKNEEALKNLQEAVFICLKWDKEQLSRYKYDAALERDKAILQLAELERTRSRYAQAEVLYRKVLTENSEKSEFSKVKMTLLDPMETVDRLHKLQHIEMKLGKRGEALKLQEEICNILDGSVRELTSNSKNPTLCDFGVREESRELDICAIMLRDLGKDKEARVYQARADQLRKTHSRTLKLNASQQDSIVDASTKLTNDLLSVKYKAGNWQQSLNNLLHDELSSEKARGELEHLPWYDASDVKESGDPASSEIASNKNGSTNKHGSINANSLSNTNGSTDEKKASDRETATTIEVDMSPMSIKSNRDGDGIAVDVQGTVKIKSSKSQSEGQQKFDFAYVLKTQSSGKQSVEDLLDNQALARITLD